MAAKVASLLIFMAAKVFAYLIVFVVLFGVVASDPDLLQDLCVANKATANPGVINNSVGSVVTRANVENIPGVNTLGVSLYRTDYAPGGLNPPHTHPRATEITFVLEGELDVGFITTANKLISKSIKKGDIFVFPKSLVHFLKNNGDKPASVISEFNSQFPGTQYIAATLFTSTPAVPDNVLTKAFQIGTKEVKKN
ncbi:hypothetical protein CRYUN_Cryun14cG0058100 [Craigia yunnanensis]